jgi:pectinesterase
VRQKSISENRSLTRRGFAFSLAVLSCAALPLRAADSSTIHLALVGDSTVTDSAGWGAAFAKRLKPEVRCTNKSRGGASTKSYYEGTPLWRETLGLKPTYILIQFGHNDQPGKGPERETDAATTFRDNLRRYIAEARAIGAKPILLSSVTRRNFKDGKHVDTLGNYAAAAKAVAEMEHVPFVDLYARSVTAVTKLGEKASADFGPMKDGKRDNTHFSPSGAAWAADLVIAELRRVVPESAAWFK